MRVTTPSSLLVRLHPPSLRFSRDNDLTLPCFAVAVALNLTSLASGGPLPTDHIPQDRVRLNCPLSWDDYFFLTHPS